MIETIAEYEGTWEELEAHKSDFAGHKLRLQVVKRAEPPLPNWDQLSIEEKIAARVAQIPAEAFKDVPPDFLDNLDHYLYGTPKT